MEVRSPNSEPDGSRGAGHLAIARQESAIVSLVFDRWSRVVPKARFWRADWVCGNREARPGLI
jgi:hypothetical protein